MTTKSDELRGRATRFFRLSLIFLLFYLILTWFFPPEPRGQEGIFPTTSIKVLDESYATGQLVQFNVSNPSNTKENIYFQLFQQQDTEFKEIPLASSDLLFQEQKFFKTQDHTPCHKEGETLVIFPQTTCLLSSENKNVTLFQEGGNFIGKITNEEGETISSAAFEVSDAGIFRSVWRALLFRPILNILVFFLQIPGHYLWLSIILLTILVKVLLIIPSKKGIIAQQKMQKIQPEIEKIKKKYANNQQAQAQEMMGLWKKHKVNPGGALLPMLIQFPIMIALFFTVKDGLLPHNEYLLYPFLQHFSFSDINFYFLGMNLAEINILKTLPLAVMVGGLQFWQMQSMVKKNANKGGKQSHQSAMKILNYILPVVVVVFSVTLPSAVALYWGISTVFAIGQQALLQKEDPSSKGKKKRIKSPPEEIIVHASDDETPPPSKPKKKKRIRA